MTFEWTRTPNYWKCTVEDDLELLVERDKEGLWFVDASSYMSHYMSINKPFDNPHRAASYVEYHFKKVLTNVHRFYVEKAAKTTKSKNKKKQHG